ncbi:interferon-induced protein 44-like [Haliotis asinina]|uniref:interferon-induced protein 44-like n=1 Tax=Haliotis asinina TaxID=109174 RepID=UPI003531B28A
MQSPAKVNNCSKTTDSNPGCAASPKKKSAMKTSSSSKVPKVLQKSDKKQLTAWLGDNKGFNLLYKASRDGCSAQLFHQKCDNKGPTVTVLYNALDCVFGGYTALSWTSNVSGMWLTDQSAFLFRLYFKGKFDPQKYPAKNGSNAIYCLGSYGPTFGGGHDLFAFSGSIPKNGQYFQVNGSTNFGTSFHMQGDTATTVTADNLQLVDVEVYQITDGNDLSEEPWRKLPELSTKALKSYIDLYAPLGGLKVNNVNILMIGAVGAGKSSYFNTINSIFRGHVTSQACSGSAEHSLTTMFRMYKVRSSESCMPLKFRLCDTRGLEEGQGMDDSDLVAILDGHLPDRYQFNPAVPISPDSAGYKKSPILADKIHCIAFVLDGCTVDVFPDKILQTIKSIQQRANQRGIPQVVLLTKVDRACLLVESDLSQIFRSATVGELVDQVAQLVGLPRAHVLPVKNYEKEMELDQNVDIPALLSLRQMLRFADDYLYNYLDQHEGKIHLFSQAYRGNRCLSEESVNYNCWKGSPRRSSRANCHT